MPGRWLIVSGEPSGDRLAQRVLDAAPTHAFVGMCGPSVSAGHFQRVCSPPPAAMGLTDVVRNLAVLASCREALLRAARGCEAAVLIDFHGFTLGLGRALRARGVKVVLLSAPQLWAWRPERVRTLGDCADVIACLLDFEPLFLRELGLRGPSVTFVGHPAAESYATVRSDARSLCLLPGSRPKEVSRLAPVMADAARMLRVRGVLTESFAALAPETPPPEAFVGIRTERGRDALARCLSDSRAALACSGTVTLECALAGVPTVVAYRTDALTAIAARALVTARFFALPNVVLGRAALPEFFQDAADARSLADAVEGALSPYGLRTAAEAAETLRARLRTPEGFAARVRSLLAGATE